MEKRGLNKQQRCFAALLKSQPRMMRPPKIHNTQAQHLLLRGHFWGTVSLRQKRFERLDLKKVIIYSY